MQHQKNTPENPPTTTDRESQEARASAGGFEDPGAQRSLRCETHCAHGSRCTLPTPHTGGHDTEHGCVCYDPRSRDVGAAELAEQYEHAEPRPRPDLSIDLYAETHRQLVDYCHRYKMDPRSFVSGLVLSELRGGSSYASGMVDGVRAGGVAAMHAIADNMEKAALVLANASSAVAIAERNSLYGWAARIRDAVKP